MLISFPCGCIFDTFLSCSCHTFDQPFNMYITQTTINLSWKKRYFFRNQCDKLISQEEFNRQKLNSYSALFFLLKFLIPLTCWIIPVYRHTYFIRKRKLVVLTRCFIFPTEGHFFPVGRLYKRIHCWQCYLVLSCYSVFTISNFKANL